MLLNDARGSYGMYSRAGRNTIEKFHLLMRKDEILSGNPKKIYVKGQFNPDEYIKTNEDDEEIDIFAVDNKIKLDREVRMLNSKAPNYTKDKYFRKEFYKLEKIKKKQDDKLSRGMSEMPTCTKYNPKYDYVWKRCLTGPTWEKSIRRNFSAKPKNIKSPEFYLSHSEISIKGKNMVDLARMTHREMFKPRPNIHSTRNKLKDINSSDDTDNNQRLTTNYNTDIKLTSNKVLSTDESQKSISYKEKKEKKVKKRRYTKIQAPDFKKTISREQLDRIFGEKDTVIPFSLPNYKWTTSRPIVMVHYNKMLVRKSSKLKEIHESAMDYDPDKILEKVNNHKKPITPNFDLMTSRPTDEGPLPSYMKKIYNKQSTHLLTENSLKMNNFAHAKFSSPSSCFWPKKSFNKIINLNLMNSTKFKENLGINSEIKNTDIDNYIQKSMKFYNKNFDELMKESLLNKFDNVTFKTVKRASKLHNGELEKFFVSLDKGDL